MSLNWYRRYPAQAVSDPNEAGLSFVERAALQVLRDLQWLNRGKGVTNDMKALARQAGAVTDEERAAVARVAKTWFRPVGGRTRLLHDPALSMQYAVAIKQQAKREESASKAGKASAERRSGQRDVDATLNATSTDQTIPDETIPDETICGCGNGPVSSLRDEAGPSVAALNRIHPGDLKSDTRLFDRWLSYAGPEGADDEKGFTTWIATAEYAIAQGDNPPGLFRNRVRAWVDGDFDGHRDGDDGAPEPPPWACERAEERLRRMRAKGLWPPAEREGK